MDGQGKPQDGFLTAWENMRTGETDWRSTPPQDYSDYIPQDESVQALYRLYQQMGDSPSDAALKVLKICVGEQP
jgi:hypothetical protein